MPALVWELLLPLEDATHKECWSSSTSNHLIFEDQDDTTPGIIAVNPPKLAIGLIDHL